MLTARKPAFCASIAQASPVGPAPTTTTSHDSLMRLQTTRIGRKGDAAADCGFTADYSDLRCIRYWKVTVSKRPLCIFPTRISVRREYRVSNRGEKEGQFYGS